MGNLNEQQQQLSDAIGATTNAGHLVVGHFGAIQVEGKPCSWVSIRYETAVTSLLANPDYKVAQILSVLGSEVRLAILRTLLDAPRTAAELVATLNLGTSGQAYHHLRELERAGYVQQKSGGKWHFDLRVGRVYLTALAIAADAGAKPEAPEEQPTEN